MSTSSVNYSSTISAILGSVSNALSGNTMGIDVGSTVSEMMQVERLPEAQLQSEQTGINSQLSALTALNTQLSTVSTDVNNLKDILGALSQKTTGSSDSNIVSASADNTAIAGTHSVVVSQLATTSSSYSGYIPGDSSLAGAEIDIKYGADPTNPGKTDTIDIPSTDTTLQQAASSINGGSYGVTANVVTDSQGSRLVLVSKNSGAAGNLTVNSSAAGFTSTAGVDAKLTVDGVPVDSATNTVTGAIAGVTLSLGASDINTTVQLSVEPDTTQATQAIQSLVTDYNTLMQSINGQYTLDSNGNEGILAGDSTLRGLQSQILGLVSTTVSGVGPYVNLQSMGIEMQDDGTLQIDSSVLSNALSSNYSEVQNFFQSTSPSGWGQTVSQQLLQMTDVTEGPIAVDINGLNSTNQDLTGQINDFEARMSAVQQQLTSQYSSLNAMLEEYPMQMAQISAQLGSLSGTNSSASGSNS